MLTFRRICKCLKMHSNSLYVFLWGKRSWFYWHSLPSKKKKKRLRILLPGGMKILLGLFVLLVISMDCSLQHILNCFAPFENHLFVLSCGILQLYIKILRWKLTEGKSEILYILRYNSSITLVISDSHILYM